MAFESWNSKTNTVSYNEEIYDTSSNTWIADPSQKIPSSQKALGHSNQKLNLAADIKITL